jgi:chromosome segregation ATPase
VNEEAELEKEMATIQTAMERLQRKLEGFERKMSMLKGHMTHYEKLTFKTLQLYKSYENGLAALKAQSEGLDEDPFDDGMEDMEGSESESEDVFPMASDKSEDRPIE